MTSKNTDSNQILRFLNKSVSLNPPNLCLENHLQLVNVLEDAALVIKKEKQEESKKSEASGQIYNILLNYV